MVMNKNLQIKRLKEIFTSLNPYVDTSVIDWEAEVDPTLHFWENRKNLSEKYPQYKWYPEEEITPEEAEGMYEEHISNLEWEVESKVPEAGELINYYHEKINKLKEKAEKTNDEELKKKVAELEKKLKEKEKEINELKKTAGKEAINKLISETVKSINANLRNLYNKINEIEKRMENLNITIRTKEETPVEPIEAEMIDMASVGDEIRAWFKERGLDYEKMKKMLFELEGKKELTEEEKKVLDKINQMMKEAYNTAIQLAKRVKRYPNIEGRLQAITIVQKGMKVYIFPISKDYWLHPELYPWTERVPARLYKYIVQEKLLTINELERKYGIPREWTEKMLKEAEEEMKKRGMLFI